MAHPIRPESYIAMDNFYTVDGSSGGTRRMRARAHTHHHTVCPLHLPLFSPHCGVRACPLPCGAQVTVYNKGAEVIRMYKTLLGAAGFRKGMDLYFARHDGQAVTCDDFRAAMADATGRDLSLFERWYLQAGTPTVTASSTYDDASQTYKLTLSQATPPTPGQPEKLPFHIPVEVSLTLYPS